jgi:alkaline phosphatase D
LRRRDFLWMTASAAAAGAVPGCAGRARQNPRFATNPFALGVASGYPTPAGVVLWTRLAPSPLEPLGGMSPEPVTVRWEIAADERMRRVVASGIESATADWAFSVHAEPQGLEPARDYWYRFTAGNARSVVGRTRTAPAASAPASRLRLAVASCQQYEHGYYAAYRHMLADDLDAIVHVGDYIYENSWGDRLVRRHDTEETYTLEDYRRRYALYRGDRDLAAAHAAYPWLITWDDHEVDNDYVGDSSRDGDDPHVFLARRAAAYRAFYEHLPLPRAAMPSSHAMRLHAQRTFGDLACLALLDQRQYRSRQACTPPGKRGAQRVVPCAELDDPSRTMLGGDQEQWLYSRLAESRTRWNLLAQGVVMSYIDEDPGEGRRHWSDSWSGYPPARKRLLDFLRERRIANPIVLSGDIHSFVAGVLNAIPEDPGSPAVATEFVTTSITSQGLPDSLVRNIVSNPNIAHASSSHRGYLRLDVSRERVQADLIGLDDATRADSGRSTLAAFVVEHGRAALVRA